MREAIILQKTGDNQYLADFGGVKCTAIYNPFVGTYYVDDKYGIVKDRKPKDRKPKDRGAR
jgi:hypothetical protein